MLRWAVVLVVVASVALVVPTHASAPLIPTADVEDGGMIALHNAPPLAPLLPLDLNYPSITNNQLCRFTLNNTILQLMADSACVDLLTTLKAKDYQYLCAHPCFNKYLDGYRLLFTRACLTSGELTPERLQQYICQMDGAPPLDCDPYATSALSHLSDTCPNYITSLSFSASSLDCTTPCFASYLSSYETYWNKSCLVWEPSALSPSQFQTLTCQSASPSPLPPSPSPSPSFLTSPSPSTSLSTSASESPSPSPIDTPVCDGILLSKLGPLRFTLCRVLVGGEETGEDVCSAPCFEEFVAGYQVLYESGCVRDTIEVVRNNFCNASKIDRVLPQLYKDSAYSRLQATLHLPLSSRVKASDFFLSCEASVLTILNLVANKPTTSTLITLIKQEPEDGSINVSFQLTLLSTDLDQALTNFRNAVKDDPSPLQVYINDVFEKTKSSSCPFVIQPSVVDLHGGGVRVCENLQWESLAMCKTEASGDCGAYPPQQACCGRVMAAVSSRCDSYRKDPCGMSMDDYLDNNCLERPAPRPVDDSGPALGGNKRCLTSHNYTWCESLHMCVQNWEGGHRGPCPATPTPTPIPCPEECKHGHCAAANVCTCEPGYGGHMCSIACPYLCSGNGYCNVNRTCDCSVGWFGPHCNYTSLYDVPGRETNDCGGHPYMCNNRGKCIDHNCTCNYGFRGNFCEIMVFESCPHTCSDKGYACHNGTCACVPGYSGPTCSDHDLCSDLSHCSGHGICNDVDESCTCFDGYQSEDCSKRVPCAMACSGHGTCSDFPDYECTCDANYAGVGCNHLSRSRCPHGCSGFGRCHEDTATCHCIPGFAGLDCSQISIPDVCRRCKHGTCDYGDKDTPASCVCHDGWDGIHCDQITMCKPFDFCSGRGECINHTCVCFPGFTGPACNLVDSYCKPEYCSGHGRCVLKYTMDKTRIPPLQVTTSCVCDPTWEGENCEISACEVDAVTNEVCSGHGVCETVEYFGINMTRCTCDAGYVGVGCDEVMAVCPSTNDKVCSGNGRCADGLCVCDAAYQGPSCSILKSSALDGCCPLDCSGNGECVDCRCKCATDWTGSACEQFASGDASA